MSDARRCAVVTGGDRGIGRAVAVELARRGVDVGILYKSNEDAATEAAKLVAAEGARAHCEQADVRRPEDVERAFAGVAGQLGEPDILVCSAGIVSRGREIADTEPEEFQKLLDVHLFGTLHCVRAMLPFARRAPRGDIIVLSSVITKQWRPNTAPYAVAKASLEALVRVLAHEERRHDIRVNAVAPSVANTDMGRRLISARGYADVAAYASENAFAGIVEPEDVAAFCGYLVSDRGGMVSGQVLYIDGAAS